MRARVLFGLVLVTSCGLPLSDLAPFPCAADTSCPSDFTCKLGSCQPTCHGTEDCPDGESCTDSGVCMHNCVSGNFCPSGVCTRGGTCQDETTCGSDADCSTAKSCCDANGGMTCIATDADPMNCGGCGNACPSDATCSGGSCACDDPALTACGQLCTDTASDAANCGRCGDACSNLETCVGGACQCTGPHLMICGNACTDLYSDNANCGVCGDACTSLQTCQMGTCACAPQNVCGASCVDKSSDANNCGACGHSCQGSACVNGQCKAIVIAKGTQQVRGGIAVASGNVHFTQAGTSNNNYADGSEAFEPTTQMNATISPGVINVHGPEDMTQYGGYVFFAVTGTDTGDGSVLRCPATNCNSTNTVVVASSRRGPWGLFTDGSKLYWAERGTSANNFNDGQIAFCPVLSSCGATPTIVATGLAGPQELTAAGGKIYWTIAGENGSVMSAAASAAAAVTTLVTGRPQPYGIATDGTNLYWAESGTDAASYANGNIVSCAISGCSNSLTVLANKQLWPARVLLDGQGHLYWNDLGKEASGGGVVANTGSIMKCGLPGCMPQTLESGVNTPYAIAADATFLYMTTWDGVYKLAR